MQFNVMQLAGTHVVHITKSHDTITLLHLFTLAVFVSFFMFLWSKGQFEIGTTLPIQYLNEPICTQPKSTLAHIYKYIQLMLILLIQISLTFAISSS